MRRTVVARPPEPGGPPQRCHRDRDWVLGMKVGVGVATWGGVGPLLLLGQITGEASWTRIPGLESLRGS